MTDQKPTQVWHVGDRHIDGDNDVYDQDGFGIADIPSIQIYEHIPDGEHWASKPEYRRELSVEEQMRIAYMVAAAPKMLAALEHVLPVVQFLSLTVDHPTRGPEFVKLVAEVNAIIELAKGEGS